MLLTEKELCERLKVERPFLFKYRQCGMPFIRLGPKIIRYDYDTVLKWFNKNYAVIQSTETKRIYAETHELLKLHARGVDSNV